MWQYKATIPTLFLLYFAENSLAATMIYPAKEGEQVSLDLGPNIVTWGRVRNNVNEFIKYCNEKDTHARCHQFINEDNQPSTPITSAHVNKNGTLVIDSFKATDVGDYFSPDELERVSSIADITNSRTLMFQW
ncbi:hypothetical protein OESDEN_12733 [Oesophagostomum dentatum]|uniref:Uncharacterized protein n=1 Tax=Oesophagostomum dentatum TaxID=61180 RepID=A0A0B1SUC3_OESDE|nr:hypothetical protein OESDEN_12733 [Oesophagostomum dentatum]